jgi:transcriptional regulator with XRE-family HTH domain
MGRPYPTHTKIGLLMKERGLRVQDVCMKADIYNRSMTDILAGRKPPSSKVMMQLSEYFRVPPKQLLESEYPWTLAISVVRKMEQEKVDGIIKETKKQSVNKNGLVHLNQLRESFGV